MSVLAEKRYGAISWTELVGFSFLLFSMPVILSWTLLTSPFVEHSRMKSWRRVLGDKAYYHVTSTLSITQMQYIWGTTDHAYEVWAKKNGLPIIIDELGEDARLLWIGKQRTDRVILYFHGGAYLTPMLDFMATFWKHIHSELKHKGINVGFAILNYSLVPTAGFPTQLKQAILALQHLISAGAEPKNIQIVGDSAGGNLIFGLISHILHPLENIPPVTLSAPIRGIYAMSPWVSLSSHTPSMIANDKSDVVGHKVLAAAGKLVLADVPAAQRVYIEAVHAPDAWFQGADAVVARALITAGEVECMRDDIVRLADIFSRYHVDAQLVVQKHGVHNDPYFDFLAGELKLCELTTLILEWLADSRGV